MDWNKAHFDGLGSLFGAETFAAKNIKKPKLTPKQLQHLNMMKNSYDGDAKTGYAYVEVSSRGWKPYNPRTVRGLVQKDIISVTDGNGNKVTGYKARIDTEGAYLIQLNPIAAEYPFSKPYEGNVGWMFEDKWIKTQKQKTPPAGKQGSVGETKYTVIYDSN